MESKLATSGFMSYFEKLIRAHPLIYIFLRSMVRFTNIFEKDFDGVKRHEREQRPGGKDYDLLKKIPPGQNYLFYTKKSGRKMQKKHR